MINFSFQGDYGTGKTLILDSVARKMKNEGGNVKIISALDYQYGVKKTDDVLDILFRQRYNDLGITFVSMADLRRKKKCTYYLHILFAINSF